MKSLPQKLRKLSGNIGEFEIEDIVADVSNHQYKSACGTYFKFKHGMSDEEFSFTPSHPNQYFEKSRELLKNSK